NYINNEKLYENLDLPEDRDARIDILLKLQNLCSLWMYYNNGSIEINDKSQDYTNKVVIQNKVLNNNNMHNLNTNIDLYNFSNNIHYNNSNFSLLNNNSTNNNINVNNMSITNNINNINTNINNNSNNINNGFINHNNIYNIPDHVLTNNNFYGINK